MGEEVTVLQDEQIILINSTGIVNTIDLLKSVKQVSDISKEHGIYKVLVDTVKQTEILSWSPSSEFISSSKFIKILKQEVPDSSFAIIVGSHTAMNQKLIELAAEQKGLYIKVFTSKKSAVEWLHCVGE